MKIKMNDGMIYIIEANPVQTQVFKSWKDVIRWDRNGKMWEGPISLALLERLDNLIPMPEIMKAELARLKEVQAAVDRERVRPPEDVRPYYPYPVKKSLYNHQIRAANMALLVFGITDPKEAMR